MRQFIRRLQVKYGLRPAAPRSLSGAEDDSHPDPESEAGGAESDDSQTQIAVETPQKPVRRPGARRTAPCPLPAASHALPCERRGTDANGGGAHSTRSRQCASADTHSAASREVLCRIEAVEAAAAARCGEVEAELSATRAVVGEMQRENAALRAGEAAGQGRLLPGLHVHRFCVRRLVLRREQRGRRHRRFNRRHYRPRAELDAYATSTATLLASMQAQLGRAGLSTGAFRG